MQDNNDIIRPVENLQNVGAMAPIDKHAEKKQKQSRHGRRRPMADQTGSPRFAGEAGWPDETAPPNVDQTDTGSIDYRA